MATIRLDHISKTYSRTDLKRPSQEMPPRHQWPINALDDLSLTIADGQTLAIVGPSGCGKSTLLRVIAGLTDYVGTVFYDEANINLIPVRERYIGMVFQNYALYPHFHGHGNLSFFYKLRKAPSAEIAERVQITSDIMGIGFQELLRRKPGTLSGGQQQRVAIARAITRKPALFLLDEPLSNLDAKLRTQTRIELRKLLNRFHITTVYVTHDQVEALSLGDSIAVMRAGRIVQRGTYQNLLHNPTNAFVAGFLGLPPMNLLPGTVQGGQLHLSGFSIPLPHNIAQQTRKAQAVTLGFHSDAALVNLEDNQTQPSPHFRARVTMIEPDFGRRRQIIFVRYNDGPFRVTAPSDISITPGQEIGLTLPPNTLYFFDTNNETRIM